MRIKVRLGILLGEVCLTTVACLAVIKGMPELATACVVGIAATLPKLVESEEKGT